MRNYINAAQLLNEGNYINTNGDLTLHYVAEDGSDATYIIQNAKDNIIDNLITNDIEDVIIKWFATVFLNFAKRDGLKEYPDYFEIVSDMNMDIKTYITQIILELTGGSRDQHIRPSEEKYPNTKKGIQIFLKDCLDSLPAWARNGDLLFSGNFDIFYSVRGVTEIIDYLTARVAANENISVISVPDAIRLSQEWHKQTSKDPKLMDVMGTDIKIVQELPNDCKMVQLLTPKALDRETFRCKHCIGQGGYDKVLTDKSQKLLSLRDSDDNPRATIHVQKNNQIIQLVGSGNGPVNEAYWPMIKDFIIQNKLIMIRDFDKIGLIKSS